MPLYPSDRSRDGGVDEIPLPAGVRGRLWLCGKHAIGPDVDRLLGRLPAERVLCLVERHELAGRYDDYVEWLVRDARAWWYPIPDLHAPSVEQAATLAAEAAARLRDGARLVAHCAAGIGRAGTFAVTVLLALGQPLDEALATVASARPHAGPEVGAQRDLVTALATR